MKKVLISSVVALVVLFVFASGTAFAHNQQVTLPPAGLTPESSFYFLDRFSEGLRQFFTFNPEGKARLQITFAAERIAEIKVILETMGVEAKGLEIAQSRLQAQLASAAAIVTDLKSEDKDAGALASELSNAIEMPKSVLAQTFKEQKRALEAREEKLKTQLRAAHRAGDTAKEETSADELGKIKARKELLELKEEDIDDDIEEEEEHLEEQMEAQKKAEKAIRKAEKEKQEVLDEADEEGLTIPPEAFNAFEHHLSGARSALAAGEFDEAKHHAKEAKEILDDVKDAIEDLEEAKEEKNELKKDEEERKEKLLEAQEKRDEKMIKEVEEDAERLEKEQKKAEEKTLKAEEKLREVGQNEEEDD